ncbi:MAG: Mov34/MPN/PAD-1 family protein [Candidatus Diapherotrites archaeon]|nr:Mov34/MPN/PAD-1 family protein [Candidatus Diapherotrites archaeon]
MVKIKRGTLEDIAEAARNVYPDEFIALLGSKKGVINHLVVLPATFGSDSSSLRLDLLPFDMSVAGSVHSHPSRNARPSRGDLGAFTQTGEIHLIIAFPFSLSSIRAFNAKGKELEIEAIE